MEASPPRAVAPERLRFLASAIAGRPLAVAPIARGERAWTDGATIHLPAGTARHDELRMLVLQASLVAAGSLTPEVIGAMVRRPALARRYLAVEGHRALAATEGLLPAAVHGLVDHQIAGSATTPQASLDVARTRMPLDEPPSWFGALEPRRVLAATDREPTAPSIAETAAIRQEATAARDLTHLADDDGLDDDPDFGGLLSSPVGKGGALGRLLARLLAPTRGRGGGGTSGADAPTHVSRSRPGAGKRDAVTALPATALDGASPVALSGAVYPEWDVRKGRYREDWCTVAEVDPPVATAATSHEGGAALRRPLARLGVGRTLTRRQRDGDDIDLDAAVEARVDHLAGLPHEDGVYIDSLPRRRDLAILILLDVSGSAGEPGTAGRSVHEHQRAVAAELLDAAYGLGDRVALYGFNSRGRTAVQLLRVKAFDDQLDGQAVRRLGGLAPAAYTRLGAAIRHGAAILEARGGTPRRLLVVLSDGFAYDHGYEGRYGEGDARRALVEARRRGMGCLCLSVGAEAEPAALRRVFGPAAHATVPRPEQLPTLIGPLFRAALRSAEAQQRMHQRRQRDAHHRRREQLERGSR